MNFNRNIDLLSVSFIYRDLFDLEPKLYEAYNLFVEKRNEIRCDQEPFKILLHKYNEGQNNLIFITADETPVSYYEDENSEKTLLNLIFNNKDQITVEYLNEIESTFKNYCDVSSTFITFSFFFVGLKFFKNHYWYVYYQERNDFIINVIDLKNDEFLKKLTISTNENIYDEKYIIKQSIQEKLIERKSNFSINSIKNGIEYFCI